MSKETPPHASIDPLAASEATVDAPHASGDRELDAGAARVEACPYLLAASGDWRSSSPSSEHRCSAFAPSAPLALDKQRRLCLTAAHEACATYIAALSARRERGTPSDGPSPTRWALARTTPVVDVGVGLGAAVSGLLAERRGWQAIPALVLVIAVIAVGLSGLGRDRPLTGAISTATPTAASTSTSPPPPTRTPAASPSATVDPSQTPTPTPVVTPATTPVVTPPTLATPRTSYTVRPNDTLYDIAITYGTTVAAIKRLNGLTSNIIHAGQVLLIP